MSLSDLAVFWKERERVRTSFDALPLILGGTPLSIIGSLGLSLSIAAGVVIDQSYDGTGMPIAISFFSMGIAAFIAMIWTEWR